MAKETALSPALPDSCRSSSNLRLAVLAHLLAYQLLAKQLEEVLDEDDMVPLFLDLLLGRHQHGKALPVRVQIVLTGK